MSRLLGEHQKQLNSSEQQLAEKEDTIHSLRGQLERSETAVKQVNNLRVSIKKLLLIDDYCVI